MTIYMYLTQEFKNRAENLIGIQNSHGQHPCPFWKFLHREYRPFGNIFWYLDRDLDWDLQRSRGAAGPEEEEEYALVWRARLRALSICFCAFPCALFADVPAASPTAFSRDIVKWREEKLVSVCFRFRFFVLPLVFSSTDAMVSPLRLCIITLVVSVFLFPFGIVLEEWAAGVGRWVQVELSSQALLFISFVSESVVIVI